MYMQLELEVGYFPPSRILFFKKKKITVPDTPTMVSNLILYFGQGTKARHQISWSLFRPSFRPRHVSTGFGSRDRQDL